MCCDVFFFFKQKTAYEMRISDWSSDVCSSDLMRRLREIGDRDLRFTQPAHMGDEARRLDRKDEILRRRFSPAGVDIGCLQAIEGAVDLDAAEDRARMGQFAPMRQAFREEIAPPRSIGRSEEHTSELQSLMRNSHVV